MNMLLKVAVLVPLAILVAYTLYLALRSLRRRCCPLSADVEDAPLGDSLLPKDFSIGETLKRPKLRKEARIESTGTIVSRDTAKVPADYTLASSENDLQNRSIVLEVISGPATGTRLSKTIQETTSISVGRIQQNDLVLTDSEVSGKHAFVNWNHEVSRWEVVDMGSLNGTLVNLKPISGPGRRRSPPVGLSNNDVLTLGSASQVLVRISGSSDSRFSVSSPPFGVGVAADAMSLRKEKLAMEDVCHCEWPLRGISQFGVFCIFDGHGGVHAAEAASRILPQKLSDMLCQEQERIHVLTQFDASRVLKYAFKETEDALNCCDYEGCTATVALLWSAGVGNEFFVQCANVGDSACVVSVEGKQVVMTQDHRLTSQTERKRLSDMGKCLKDGETRLCGMNISRALGDKYLKEEESCFSAEPYVSKALKISKDSRGMLVMASDGLWDVLSPLRALQLAMECRDSRLPIDGQHAVPHMNAEAIAQVLVQNARLLRTKDNTTVIVVDFGAAGAAAASSKPSFSTL